MGITPPRCPRARTGPVAFETRTFLGDFSPSSKLAEESKASSASFVVRAVIVVPHYIHSPVFPHPLAPRYGKGLTLEIRKGRCRSDQLIGFFAKTSPKRQIVVLVSSLGHGHKSCRRENRTWIAHVETNSFFKNPRFGEVVSAADKKTVIPVDVLCSVVTEAERRDQLLASKPFLVDEPVAAEARPEKPSDTGTHSQRAIPIRIEVVGIAGSKVYASIAEFMLTVDLRIPDVVSLCHHATGVSTRPVTEAVGQSQIVAAGFHIVGKLLRPRLRREIRTRLLRRSLLIAR